MSKKLLAAAWILCALSTFAGPSPVSTDYNVTRFGALADAKTDNTAAFQKALDAAKDTGGRVIVPAGRYVIRGHLSIPESVELTGSFDAPPRSNFSTGMLEKEKGTSLLAYAGKGDETGEPFITLNRASHLHGL
ncbi:MAG TPA: glycosyl hydrolase family 28-related protein, partial [Tepidisphaeraceae bacterium]|nr:glycosyl hydrolase family 28-related protein [Tepidisphaeraceae bacterium]